MVEVGQTPQQKVVMMYSAKITLLILTRTLARCKYKSERRNEANGVMPMPAPQQTTVS